ncbi:CDP-glycerol glycerophosphotransferase family protein [uncultured Fusobacterium sp.]|uniref:CDP-glycerol glycerophosphotransferase family protein n=1 Tax=uncultured Fusobacterium sp. TaxID=159267 RepID=UPI0026286EC2|nr:CDP-glycerol glycerophosphotransferase family protein [uncultured Fusobacterium sp.]
MELIDKVKRIKIKDLLAIFIFFCAIPEAILLKKRRKDLWLICEREDEARDNGYFLFKYIRENYPLEDVVYAIKKDGKDYNKVKNLGEIIEYGGYKHWVYYLAASKNISSHKGGKPNAAVCYFLEVFEILKNKRVFLQHGVIKDDLEWLYYKNTKMRLFICGAEPEYEYIKEKFGYPEEYVKYTGLARFDNLHNFEIKQNQILVMPTWRVWLRTPSVNKGNSDKNKIFIETNYYKRWYEFLNDDELIKYIEKNNLIVIFYPHSNMQKFIEKFETKSKNIKIASDQIFDIQTLLKESEILITDYSSVFMDFAYMRKPIIYYQFDKKDYREGQYKEGYFNYERDGFGPVVETMKGVVENLVAIRNQDKNKYLEKQEKFFKLYDTNNSKRNYDEIKKI